MHVLVVDDDLVLSDVISFTLRRAGFEVVLANNGISALEVWKATSPTLIVMDWEMPGMSGIEACQEIRKTSNVPIIMLTVRDTNDDILKGLGIGADDYIKKPFSPTELVARIKAVVRRVPEAKPLQRLAVADLKLNPVRRTLERAGKQPIRLTMLEFRLLEALISHSGHVLPTDTLIDHVWENGGDRAMLKQLIYRVRRKTQLEPTGSVYIEVIPGVGYSLVAL
ncbi:MAG TPA: response regulator transcription factor [Phototrophicaceae bacterium]|jgi:DNA-binding response OmpR family regulator|nr:response regulator transcription factor [Phototrophicaceae bacterium]